MRYAIREWLSTRWRGYLHGGAWKIGALFCKFAFLVYFAPRMPGGEFAKFLFWQSAGLLSARALAFGMLDELPVRVRGKAEESLKFWPLIRTLQCVSLVMLLFAWSSDSPLLAGMSLVPIWVTGAIMEGVIRTLSPVWSERALNWPWLLFVALLVLGGTGTSVHTLHLYATALLASQLSISFLAKPKGRLQEPLRLIPAGMISVIRHGSVKMVSDFTLIANQRAPVLLPALLAGALQSDRISFALAIADAVASLFMVIVNRNYILYCQHDVKARSVLLSVAIIVTSMALVGAGAVLAGSVAPTLWPKALLPMDLFWTCLFFGAITAYQDARYYYWARNDGVYASIVVQLMALLAQAGIILMLPSDYWLPVTSISLASAVAIVGASVFRAPQHVPRRS